MAVLVAIGKLDRPVEESHRLSMAIYFLKAPAQQFKTSDLPTYIA